MIGRVLDERYQIVRLLGRGGMGAVYEARHAGTGRRVALKVILAQSLQDEHVARFQREARAVGAIESQHIAQVFDTGRDRETGAPYIAMEFLEGEDVQALVERLGPLPVDLALRVACQACLGLERAHRAGVVHRDIKAANLFVAKQESGQRVVKLLDFGVAKMIDPTAMDHGLTKTGAMIGSPLYMSPEQARGSAVVDARSDVWSLGITLYQCLSGRRPNDHIQALGELIMTICTTPARWIQDVAPWVPPAVAQVVHRALVIDPAQRFQSASELAAALRALLPHGAAIEEAMLAPIGDATRAQVAPRARLEQSGAVGATTYGVTGVPAARPASSGPRAALLALAAIGAVALGGLGAWLVLRGPPPEPAPEPAPAAAEAPSTPPVEPPALAPSPAVTPADTAPPASASASAPVAPYPTVTAPARPTTNVPKPPTFPKPPPRPTPTDDETSRK